MKKYIICLLVPFSIAIGTAEGNTLSFEQLFSTTQKLEKEAKKRISFKRKTQPDDRRGCPACF